MRGKYIIKTIKQQPTKTGRILKSHKLVANILTEHFKDVKDLYSSKDIPELNISLPELVSLYTVFQITGFLLGSKVYLGFPKDKNSPEIDDGYIKIGNYIYVVETVSAFISHPYDKHGMDLYALILDRLKNNKFTKSRDYPRLKHLAIITDDPLMQELPIIENIIDSINHSYDFESYWLIGVSFQKKKPCIRVYHYDPDAENLGFYELLGEVDFLHGKIYKILLN